MFPSQNKRQEDIEHQANEIGKIAIIVLAAGSSSRLGQPKQLVEIEHQSLIYRQCQLASTLTPHVYCVIGCQALQMRSALSELEVNVVENIAWSDGMGSSISAAISQLPVHIEAAMIVLVDQWKLTQADLNLLVKQHINSPQMIIQSRQVNRQEKKANGPPVIFPKRFFTNLIGLKGEQGAKPIVEKFKSSTLMVDIPNAFEDIDTPEQLAKVTMFLSKMKKD
ncbi:nucleotidyltransferase family protein [Thalassotalea atypica]|uniref:nucleotidyltransferase family protein n=1 Tax=Thalassotalea atypica TaxID=2054316 RepID=UPI0025731899|nr:nucleotidyltransferase family protein [Thalassotalea atypica]